jgi:glycogen debranching enzyme
MVVSAETHSQEMPLPRLLEGEELREVKEFDESPPSRQPSTLYDMVLLGRVQSAKELGDSGPVLAALSIGRDEHAPDFRKYEAVFGRDALRVALDLIHYRPKLARSTLLALAHSQGVQVNDSREEEPGRIIHEDRDPHSDPVARDLTERLGWGWPYYGSIDATPEFIRTLAAYCRQPPEGLSFLEVKYKARDGVERTMLDALVGAVDWLTGRLNSNTEGLLESKRANPHGIENQVWKDSWDSYFHANGEIANHDQGVASVEAQRVAFDALLDAAELYEQIPRLSDQAPILSQRAEDMRQAIFKYFWTDERGGYFVLGTDRGADGHLRQLKLKTSNMGHLLHSRLLEGERPEIKHRRQAVIKQLFSPELFCKNGIRTLATDEVRFRPGAYHNGSVWVWDNYLIAQGLAQNGYYDAARLIENVLLKDIQVTRRLVEFLRGNNEEPRINTQSVDVFDHINNRMNRIEQPPQDIQAWSVAAILAIKLRRLPHNSRYMVTDPQKRRFESKLLKDIGQTIHPSLDALLPKLAGV